MSALLSRKENLWPHLREFADRGIAHCKKTLVKLTEDHTPCELYSIHGHYADASEAAAMMAATLGVDMVMTGHSLGRNKLEHLLASGELTFTGDDSSLWPSSIVPYCSPQFLHKVGYFFFPPQERI